MKFSFIIPIYNISGFISECIESILMQDYDDYEIILVNDGSTDASKQVCLEYCHKTTKIKYFEKLNGGLSDARNFGIDKARGDYFIFIDGDDFYNSLFLKNINNLVIKNNADIVLINNKKVYPDGYSVVSHPQKNIKKKESFFSKNIFKACAWDKIIKRDFLVSNNLYFEKGLLSEDILWCGQILFFNPKILYYSSPVYSYRQRSGSITKQVSPKHIYDYFYMVDKLIKQYPSRDLFKYLSFEFSALIFIIATQMETKTWKKFESQVRDFSFLLKYSATKKSFFVRFLYKIFGYKNSCIILRFLSKIRKGKSLYGI